MRARGARRWPRGGCYGRADSDPTDTWNGHHAARAALAQRIISEARPSNALGYAISQGTRQRTIERGCERLLVLRRERPRSTGLDARSAERVREIARAEPLTDRLRRVLVATRIDDHDASRDEDRSQWD